MAELKPGWQRVKFGEVVRQVKDKVDPERSGLIRFVAGEHMDTDDLRIQRWGEIGDGYLGPAFHMRFKPGQVLYGSRRTYLRKVAVPDFEGVCANTTFVLESANPEVLLPELLPFIMTTEAFHEHSQRESKGSVNPYVNFSDLAWHEFNLPPPVEQSRIAKAGGALITNLNSLHDLKQAAEKARRAYLLDVFADMQCEYKPISELGEVTMGRQRAPRYEDGPQQRPYLRVANVFDGFINETDILQMHFSDSEFDKYRLAPGDILLNEGQSRHLVGRSAIVGKLKNDCAFQNTLIRVRPKLIEAEYAHAYFQFCLYSGKFAKMASQTTSIAHLGVKNFAMLNTPFPEARKRKEILSGLMSLNVFSSDISKHYQELLQFRHFLFAEMGFS